MAHGERDEFNQRRRQNIPLRREIICRTSASVYEFNRLLNPLLIKHIESLELGYYLHADRTGNDGCYSARNPITYWRINKPIQKKLNPNWKERLFSFFASGDYVGEIVTESLLLDRLRLRFYIRDNYWKDLEDTVNAIFTDMLSGNEGFGVGTENDSSHQLQISSTEKIVILFLFLTAFPVDSDKLRLDKEAREIDTSLRATALRDKFEIEQCWAVRVSDIQSALLRYRPHIVHFSGHSTKSGELIVENDFGDCTPIPPTGLGRLFGILRDRVMCVVLNACYSEQQAQEISKNVDYVIGMNDAIYDDSAIIFSKAFYQALGYDRGFVKAFELGKNAIELHNEVTLECQRYFKIADSTIIRYESLNLCPTSACTPTAACAA